MGVACGRAKASTVENSDLGREPAQLAWLGARPLSSTHLLLGIEQLLLVPHVYPSQNRVSETVLIGNAAVKAVGTPSVKNTIILGASTYRADRRLHPFSPLFLFTPSAPPWPYSHCGSGASTMPLTRQIPGSSTA